MLLLSVAGFGCHRRRPPPPQSCRRRKDRQFPHLLGSRHRPVVRLWWWDIVSWSNCVGSGEWLIGKREIEKLKTSPDRRRQCLQLVELAATASHPALLRVLKGIQSLWYSENGLEVRKKNKIWSQQVLFNVVCLPQSVHTHTNDWWSYILQMR